MGDTSGLSDPATVFSLVENLRKRLAEIDESIADIKANPQRYEATTLYRTKKFRAAVAGMFRHAEAIKAGLEKEKEGGT